MLSPEFTIERCWTYGYHGRHTNQVTQPDDVKDTYATYYLFRFYAEDWPGGPIIDGIPYQSVKGYFTCCKPMQRKRYIDPHRCYLFDISTQDPQLTEALNKLPTYAFHPKMDSILDLLKKIIAVETRNTLDARLEIWSYACSILRLLLQELPHYKVEHTYDSNPRRHQDALLASLEYLKEHLEEDVDLEQLAKDSHLHPTYFHKLFTATFGRTPAQQLMYNRIIKSREYLRDDKYSMAEISRMCGFSSQSYFCRKYKELSLHTPTQYRNSIRRRRKKEK